MYCSASRFVSMYLAGMIGLKMLMPWLALRTEFRYRLGLETGGAGVWSQMQAGSF